MYVKFLLNQAVISDILNNGLHSYSSHDISILTKSRKFEMSKYPYRVTLHPNTFIVHHAHHLIGNAKDCMDCATIGFSLPLITVVLTIDILRKRQNQRLRGGKSGVNTKKGLAAIVQNGPSYLQKIGTSTSYIYIYHFLQARGKLAGHNNGNYVGKYWRHGSRPLLMQMVLLSLENEKEWSCIPTSLQINPYMVKRLRAVHNLIAWKCWVR